MDRAYPPTGGTAKDEHIQAALPVIQESFKKQHTPWLAETQRK